VGSPLERGVRPHAEPPLAWPRHLSSWALLIARWFQPPPALASDPRFVVPALPGLQHGHATNSGPAGEPVGSGTRPELARHPLSVPFPRLSVSVSVLVFGLRSSVFGLRSSILGPRASTLSPWDPLVLDYRPSLRPCPFRRLDRLPGSRRRLDLELERGVRRHWRCWLTPRAKGSDYLGRCSAQSLFPSGSRT
jgi:hypothetical protein